MRGRPINLPLLISFFYQLYYNVISQIGLNITLPLCLILSFLHNRIPCMHSTWASDNLTPLDMPFLSKVQNHTRTFIYYLLFVEMDFHFYLEKNWSGQNQSSRTVSAGPVSWYMANNAFSFALVMATTDCLQHLHCSYFL